MWRLALGVLLIAMLTAPAAAQDPSPGLNMVSYLNGIESRLYELDGSVAMTWHGAAGAASSAYLLEDGSILRPCKSDSIFFNAGGSGGRIQQIDAADNVIWDFLFSNYDHQQHHDIALLPGGNLLLIAWERKTQAEAIAAGRLGVSGEMWPTLIVEIEPVGPTGGNIVWEWHLWDHLIQDVSASLPGYGVVHDHPERFDINFGNVANSGDWIHANSVDYDAGRDQIVFSSRTLDEFYVIDHSTTTAEAAGHTGGLSGMGGDILYRWGNPQAYDRGDAGDRYFYVVHCANWIDPGLLGAGNILAYNNGNRPGTVNDYANVAEIVPPMDGNWNYVITPDAPYGPAGPTWYYGDPGDFYGGPAQGSGQRLPNGNTLICAGASGHVFEVTEPGVVVWEQEFGPAVGRALRYADETTAVQAGGSTHSTSTFGLLRNTPNPFNPFTRVSFETPRSGHVRLQVFDVQGRRVAVLADGQYGGGTFHATWNGREASGGTAAAGTYFVRMEMESFSTTRKITLIR